MRTVKHVAAYVGYSLIGLLYVVALPVVGPAMLVATMLKKNYKTK